MTADNLTPRERGILLTLMAIAEPVTNPVLQARIGTTLTGTSRTRLTNLKLVESVRVGRSFRHELTDNGWAWCAGQFGTSAPARADVGTRCLYAVLAGLGRYMATSSTVPADIFHPAQPALPLPQRVVAAYHSLVGTPGDWVNLVDLRTHLADVSADELDETLRTMEKATEISLVRDSDQRRMTSADREAAVRIGGQDAHWLMVRA